MWSMFLWKNYKTTLNGIICATTIYVINCEWWKKSEESM